MEEGFVDEAVLEDRRRMGRGPSRHSLIRQGKGLSIGVGSGSSSRGPLDRAMDRITRSRTWKAAKSALRKNPWTNIGMSAAEDLFQQKVKKGKKSKKGGTVKIVHHFGSGEKKWTEAMSICNGLASDPVTYGITPFQLKSWTVGEETFNHKSIPVALISQGAAKTQRIGSEVTILSLHANMAMANFSGFEEAVRVMVIYDKLGKDDRSRPTDSDIFMRVDDKGGGTKIDLGAPKMVDNRPEKVRPGRFRILYDHTVTFNMKSDLEIYKQLIINVPCNVKVTYFQTQTDPQNTDILKGQLYLWFHWANTGGGETDKVEVVGCVRCRFTD